MKTAERTRKIKTLETERAQLKEGNRTLSEWMVTCAQLVKINVQLKMIGNGK